MKEIEFKHFRTLQTRYWITEKIHPKDLIDGFTKKINHIENRVFGKSEDDFSGQTQIKIILNGLSLKIYYFLKQSIIYTQNKEYISAIALLRLCLEHIVMLSHFEGKLSSYIKENNIEAIQILLFSFCVGERIFYVDSNNKSTGKKRFTSRAEHVSDALRTFDKKHKRFGVQIYYDTLSSHSHVSPTSSVRLLYRQKIWNVAEPRVDLKKVRLSTTSNSHERLASVAIEDLNVILNFIEKDVIDKEDELVKSIQEYVGWAKGEINPEVISFMNDHDKLVEDYLFKLSKYGKPIIN